MCGIVGFIRKSGTQTGDNHLLQEMNDLIYYRGPDDSGYYSDFYINLGHRRLSIIDINKGHQPIFNEDKTLAIIFNGEIYNFKELKNQLLNRHKFYTDSDTEVLVHLYEDFGYKMLDLLNGMFAFVIWDTEKKELFLARDRFGEKPLYYFVNDEIFIFASEIKSILKHPVYKKEVDFENISKYLFLEYFPASSTPFKNIFKLRGGHYMVFERNPWQVISNKYWDIYQTYDFDVDNSSFESAKQELYRLFLDSVKKRLISDVEVGVFLSGGIDSSSVAMIMAKELGISNIKTFSIYFSEKSYDESVYSSRIAKFVGSDHKHQTFSMVELLNTLKEVLNKIDEPFGDSSILPTYLLSKFTSSFVKVVLSGDGGDEQFAGYPTFQAEKYYQIFKIIPPHLWGLLENFVNSVIPVNFNDISFDFKLKRFLSGMNIEDYALRHQKWIGSFDFREQRLLFRNYFADTIPRDFNFVDRTQAPQLSNLQRIAYFYIKNYLQDDILYKVDRASMFNSLEVRTPFLDYRLAHFIWQLKDKYKLNKMQTKYIFKNMLVTKLPREIIFRRKKGFSVPIGKWFKDELKRDLEDTVYNIDFFNSEYIERIIGEHKRGKFDHKKKLWTLFILGKWYNKFFK